MAVYDSLSGNLHESKGTEGGRSVPLKHLNKRTTYLALDNRISKHKKWSKAKLISQIV